MLAAGECKTWLTLKELAALTKFGEASISAQLRHLRRDEYELVKRRREGNAPLTFTQDGRGRVIWEYQLREKS